MFNKEEFNKLCQEHKTLDPEAYWDFDRVWKAMLDLVCENKDTFDGFIEYMKTEITDYEYIVLSAISDEIADMRPSMEFIEAYKSLALKYPEETKNYQIDNFIRDAENCVKYSLKKAKKNK